MSIIHKNTLFELEPETIDEVRKLYNLNTTERIEEAVDLLEAWIQKQDHFTHKDYSRDYLERIIISCKGSVERAKTQIDKLCTFRTLMPTFFEKCDPKVELNHISKAGDIVLMPKLMKGFYRIGILNGRNREEEPHLMDFYRYVNITMEYIKAHDYCTGMVIILDYTNVNMLRLLKHLNILELRQAMIITMEGYGIRVKAIHLICTSTLTENFIKILKQVLSKKIGDRIIIHKSKETLYDYIPKNLLPAEYGGQEKSIQELHDITFNAISTKEHVDYMKTRRGYQTTEKYRAKLKNDEEYLGVSGTFRTLTID